MYAYRVQDQDCKAAYESASAAAREAGEWFPDWFSFEHQWQARRNQSPESAIAEDFESLASGEGSFWQV